MLDQVGWVQDVIVNQRTGHVVDGHLRVSLAISRGEPSIPVVYVDLSEDEERLVLATFDPISAMAGTDRELLTQLLADVLESEATVTSTLQAIATANRVSLPTIGGLTDPDDVPEPPAEPITKPGDLWILGEHRVLCGDSTKAEDVERLLAGGKPVATLTDPPYGQSQDGVPGDSPHDHVRLMCEFVLALPESVNLCVSFASPRTFVELLDSLRANGWHFERMLWLYKQAQMAKPWRGWILTSESILIASRPNAQWVDVKPYAHDCYMLPDVSGEIDPGIGWHGSIKPMSVVTDLLKRVTRDGDQILDPFLGSGTTLIAAEQLGRRCYGMEIDPRYCDVIVTRWENFTGRRAELAGDTNG